MQKNFDDDEGERGRPECRGARGCERVGKRSICRAPEAQLEPGFLLPSFMDVSWRAPKVCPATPGFSSSSLGGVSWRELRPFVDISRGGGRKKQKIKKSKSHFFKI